MVLQAGGWFEQMCKDGDKEAAWLCRQQTPPADKGDRPVRRENWGDGHHRAGLGLDGSKAGLGLQWFCHYLRKDEKLSWVPTAAACKPHRSNVRVRGQEEPVAEHGGYQYHSCEMQAPLTGKQPS